MWACLVLACRERQGILATKVLKLHPGIISPNKTAGVRSTRDEGAKREQGAYKRVNVASVFCFIVLGWACLWFQTEPVHDPFYV